MESITRRLAAVAFADVAGWSRLVESNELGALRAWNDLRTRLIEPMLREHGGRLVDLAGDAVFVEFASAIDAVNWALGLQRRSIDAPAARPPTSSSGQPLRLRIGINVCELLVHEGRLTGDGVNIASRIHHSAAPGEVVATEAVREHVKGRGGVDFIDLGERDLKNISRPIRVYRVQGQGEPPAEASRPWHGEAALHTLLALDLAALPDPKAPDATTPATRAAHPPHPPHPDPLRARLDRDVLPGSGGRVVQRDDSGWVLEFPAALPAMRAAFQIQRACREGSAGAADAASWGTRLPRIGMQMAEAGAASVGAAGAGVAFRLIEIAAPGDIVVSPAVRDELTLSRDADIEDLGEHHAGATSGPMRAYRLDPPASQPAGETAAQADDLRPTLAVIPFSEHGAGHLPIGEILAEELIASFSRSHELNVVSRLSTTAFRGRAASLDQVSAHLKANYVLSGAYRVTLDAVILAAELADVKTGRVVWARDIKGSVAGIVEGRDALIDRIVAEASQALMARELERARSQSLHSLETCTLLVGGITLMHRLSIHDFNRAHAMLLECARRAPRHAVPPAWLAKWHVLRVWQSWSDDPAADTRSALDFGKRALDNDSQCSLALVIDGFVHTNLLKSLDVARERYDLALQVNPNDSLAWLLSGMLHAFKGEGAQAVKSTQRALRLSPLDPHHYFYDSLAGGAELSAGHYGRAVELTQRSLRANRMHASTFRMLAISQWQLGRHAEARATVAELMRIEPNLTVTGWLARSPSSGYPIGTLCADTLREAGVPA